MGEMGYSYDMPKKFLSSSFRKYEYGAIVVDHYK